MIIIVVMVLVIRNSKIENLGYFEKLFRKYSVDFTYVDGENLRDGLFESNINNFMGLVVLGGDQSVYEEDKFSYLSIEKKIITKFIEKDKPVLGICLGSQLIASVLGAKVYRGDKGEEIGWYDVYITDMAKLDSVFSNYYPSIKVFQWHGDTFDLPKDTLLLATSENYPNQAFRYKSNVYALQFHIEVEKDDIELWLSRSKKLSEDDKSKVLEEYYLYSNRMRDLSEGVVKNLFVLER